MLAEAEAARREDDALFAEFSTTNAKKPSTP